MKAAKIVGTGILLAALCPDVSFNPKNISNTLTESQAFEVFVNRYGKKIAITLCAVSLIGGVAYCVYKLLKPKKIGSQISEISLENMDEMLENRQLEWEISSISTNSAIQIYEELKCGISHELMVDPVNLPCSHEFSRAKIEQWLAKNKSCPKCRRPSNSSDIRVSSVTAKTIQRFKKKLLKKGKEWIQKRIEMDFQEEICQKEVGNKEMRN